MRRGSRARQRYATNGGIPAMNRENTVRAWLIGTGHSLIASPGWLL
jgi:hypothetical protein